MFNCSYDERHEISDKSVRNGKSIKQTIKLDDGFTEAETLGLFAQVLDIPVNKLPPEAKSIHRECKGMPLLIAMFAAHFEQFKEDMVDGTRDRWKYYLESLRKKDPNNRVIKKFLEKQEIIFDMCIDQLKPDLKEQYKQLAIFNEDVNITRNALQIIWNQSIFDVDELMLDLCHKSLAAKQWNKDTKSYIYGVHDLLLSHLRKKLKPDELTQLHKSVVEKYRKYCNNDFSKLPNDNYIYSYIGHHLEQAKLYEDFPKLYLNFDFIQAKIMHSGLSDLLLDLTKYRTYITCDSNKEYVSDLETFLQEQVSVIAEHRRKKCLDIIQIAMNSLHEGYITQKARDLATERQKYLYLSHDKKPAQTNTALSEEMSTEICISSFTDDPNLILTGYTSGKVILWNCENKQQTAFNSRSNESPVKKIVVSEDGNEFLILTDDGVVKMFHLSYDEQDYRCCTRVRSPKEKQASWTGFFTNDNNQDDSLSKLSINDEIILDVIFGNEDEFIATCTNTGEIQIWDLDGKIIYKINDKNLKSNSITKIAFTDKGMLLHVMNESKGSFCVYSRDSTVHSKYNYVSSYNIHEKQVIYFHKVPLHDNSLMIVTTKRALYVKWVQVTNQQSICNFIKQERAYVENDTVTYICAAITYDGEFLVVADSAGFINIWHTDVGQPIATYKNHVTSLDTYWFKDQDYHLICGSRNNLLHRWKLPVHMSPALVRKSLFDAIVQPYGKEDIIVKESYTNHMVVLRGETEIGKFTYISTVGKISSVKLFCNGEKVLYTLEKKFVSINNNKLMIYDIQTDKSFAIFESKNHIEFDILNIDGNDIIVSRDTDNSLRVWQNPKVTYLIDTTGGGRVSFIHKLNDNYVITITQNGTILIWFVDQPIWLRGDRKDIPSSADTSISFSCLSHLKTYLAVFKKSKARKCILYLITFYENKDLVPQRIEMEVYLTHSFAQEVTCCDISQNDQYIAVGLETGLISIFDIQEKKEIQQLSFHYNPIKQLSWGPIALEAPILLSLADDELAWWNVSLNNKVNVKRRSRMGITQSNSTPSFNANNTCPIKMPNSQSLNASVSNLQHNTESSADMNSVDFTCTNWKDKVSKDPEIPALLAAVELSHCRTEKVCISPDFTKFVMVDIYGSVSTFQPFQPLFKHNTCKSVNTLQLFSKLDKKCDLL
ncbi:PREDICTED: apoptotic protease-activating factor 1 isoform X2 [Dinoponera quadriceps]|uniref:Apoptotic protease-activating factor 1 isoform X2 n=1 Tax=Dinoponera quadriceps TaxID=609295 RepID=A0A6P3X8N7_DINQU|nr:PREDICTED: apoptotic protease-activating factor 1 isoform X2 [Dinoponera quadriceps]